MSDKVEKAWQGFVAALGRDREVGVDHDSGPWAQLTIESDGIPCTMRFHQSGRVFLFFEIPDIEINIYDISDDVWIAWGRYREAVCKHIRANMREEIGKLMRGAFEKESVREALTKDVTIIPGIPDKKIIATVGGVTFDPGQCAVVVDLKGLKKGGPSDG